MGLWTTSDHASDKDQSTTKTVDKEAIGEFLDFRQLKSNRTKATDFDNADIVDVAINEDNQTEEDYTSRLNRLVQLTGTAVGYANSGRHLHRSLREDEQIRHIPRTSADQQDKQHVQEHLLEFLHRGRLLEPQLEPAKLTGLDR